MRRIWTDWTDALAACTPAQMYSTFFCRMNDPSYIKDLKLQILSAVADESNAYDIVTELTEYVADIDEHQSREAVRAVGRIALEVRRVYALGCNGGGTAHLALVLHYNSSSVLSRGTGHPFLPRAPDQATEAVPDPPIFAP